MPPPQDIIEVPQIVAIGLRQRQHIDHFDHIESGSSGLQHRILSDVHSRRWPHPEYQQCLQWPSHGKEPLCNTTAFTTTMTSSSLTVITDLQIQITLPDSTSFAKILLDILSGPRQDRLGFMLMESVVEGFTETYKLLAPEVFNR
ncbi:uncharacterized protein BDV14DRAFT_195362 [Aspergillus stella-maris]|uniref:uncharacterized protein n=1 Tax=Aspergillus stella-maris TaxID=1810926 RepID=UPI003CCE4A59